MPQHYLSEFTDSKRVKVKCLSKKNWTNFICPFRKNTVWNFILKWSVIFGTTLNAFLILIAL